MNKLTPTQLLSFIILAVYTVVAGAATGYLFIKGAAIPSVLWGLDGALLAVATHSLGISSGVAAALTPAPAPLSAPLPSSALVTSSSPTAPVALGSVSDALRPQHVEQVIPGASNVLYEPRLHVGPVETAYL